MKQNQKTAHSRPFQEAAHGRVTLDAGHRPETQTPAAVLSLAQIVSLAEKRLRWYGFCDWRIHDVICNHDHTVAVQVCSRNEVVATLTFARDCGAVHYGIHMPAALKMAPAFAVHTAAGVRESAKRPGSPQQWHAFLTTERKKGGAKTAMKPSARAPSTHIPSAPAVDMPPDYNERAFGRGQAMLSSLAENG